MDVSKWPIGRIMQLPDHCFGQRWLVGVASNRATTGPGFDISELGLPEECVIWNLAMWYTQGAQAFLGIYLALGDQLPATEAAFTALEPLFKDIGPFFIQRRRIEMIAEAGLIHFPMRKYVHAGGRRLVGEFYMGATSAQVATAVITVSSVPKEVPDCLLSV